METSSKSSLDKVIVWGLFKVLTASVRSETLTDSTAKING